MCTASNDHDWVNVLDARSLPIFLPASIDTTNRSAECMQALNGTTTVVTCSDGHDTRDCTPGVSRRPRTKI
jgi:hypothetical protein